MAHQSTLEDMGVKLFGDRYRDRRVLLTGHTGFKGSWLALWLKELGAEIVGISLDPIAGQNHWELCKLDVVDHRQDIRNTGKLTALVQALVVVRNGGEGIYPRQIHHLQNSRLTDAHVPY